MILVYGGSFNPPTNTHINIAKHMIKNYGIKKVIFLPVGDKYLKKGLIDAPDRFNMLKLSIKHIKYIEISDIEIKSIDLLKTIDSLNIIQSQYSNDEIAFLIGADKLHEIPFWKDAKELIENYHFFIIPKDQIDINGLILIDPFLKSYKNNFTIVNGIPASNISSTRVRNVLYQNKYPKRLINKQVYKYIIQNQLYGTGGIQYEQ